MYKYCKSKRPRFWDRQKGSGQPSNWIFTLINDGKPEFNKLCFPSTGDCVSDVLPQIARRCHAQPSCSFPVDDRFLGSPCRSGVPKYLSIIYACVNEEVFSEAALKGNLEAMEQLGKA
jgi:hypothetical protein